MDLRHKSGMNTIPSQGGEGVPIRVIAGILILRVPLEVPCVSTSYPKSS